MLDLLFFVFYPVTLLVLFFHHPSARIIATKKQITFQKFFLLKGGVIHETAKGFSSFNDDLPVFCSGMPAGNDDSGRSEDRQTDRPGMQLSRLCSRDKSYLVEIGWCVKVFGR